MGSLFKNIALLPGRVVISLARALGLVPPAPRFYVRRPRTSPLAIFVSAFFWGGLALIIVAVNLKTVPPGPPQAPFQAQANSPSADLPTPPAAAGEGGEAPNPEISPPAETQQAEMWLVILHSIPKRAQSEDDRRAARAEADRRAAAYKRQGLDVQIFDTDSLPRLKNGFWAVALGPFETGSTARQIGDLLRDQSPSLMVRQAM